MTVRFGLLGAGRIGKVHAKAIGSNAKAKLVAVADPMADAANAIAAQYGAEALAFCAVSDHLRSHVQWSPEQRQNGLDAMVRLVLYAVLPV